jgi:cytochrome d ubiquinol oxidase subunit II
MGQKMPVKGSINSMQILFLGHRVLKQLPLKDDSGCWLPFLITVVVYLLVLWLSFYPYVVPAKLIIW